MADDPAIRSVRVAAALCDRFAELLKGPTVVTAAKSRSALLGVKGNDDALSLRLGEAQQIYPEIWNHLDEARKAFASRGANMSAFDVLRENENRFVGTGAAVNTDYVEVGDPRYGFTHTTKQAHFNTGGLQRARSAIQAIQNATPNINWAAIIKAEENDPHAAAFRRATIIKRVWMFALLIAVIGIPFWWVMWKRHEENVRRDKWRQQQEHPTYQPAPPPPPPPNALPAPEQAALREQAKQLNARLVAAGNQWPTATAEAELAKLQPGADACPLVITPPLPSAATEYIQSGNVIQEAFTASDFVGYLASDGAVPTNALLRSINRSEAIEERLAAGRGTPDLRDELKELERPLVFVIIDKDVEPKVTSTKPLKLEPGKLAARGYVFDTKLAKIICTAKLDVKGSDAKGAATYLEMVEDGDTALAEQMLHRELEIRIREGLATSLKAVAP